MIDLDQSQKIYSPLGKIDIILRSHKGLKISNDNTDLHVMETCYLQVLASLDVCRLKELKHVTH